jgi:hypothetical protein
MMNEVVDAIPENTSFQQSPNLKYGYSILISACLSLLLTITSVTLVSWNYPAFIRPSQEILDQILPFLSQHAIGWEKDRFIYLYSLLAYPILLLMTTWFSYSVLQKQHYSEQSRSKLISILGWIMIVWIVVFWVLNCFVQFLYFVPLYQDQSHSGYAYVYALIAAVVAMMYAKSSMKEIFDACLEFLARSWCYFLITALLLIIFFPAKLFTHDSITTNGNTLHTGVVMYGIVNVYYGFPLFCGYQHQYGLYPMLIAPILKMLSQAPTVFNVTLIMSILNVGTLFLLSCSLRRMLKSPVIALITSVVLLTSFMPVNFYGDNDPYYQYHPIRTLFPSCLLLLLTYRKCLEDYLYFILSTIFLAYGVLWNTDTGIVVYLTWFLANVYGILHDQSKTMFDTAIRIISLALMQCLVLAMAYGSYDAYVYIAYGQSVSFDNYFEYQKIFYVSGYFMLPTRLIHPWWSVAFAAAIGLACSLYYLCSKHDKLRGMQFFGVSILFCGMFSYYNGRSHDYTFFSVLISSFLIGFLVDEYYACIGKMNINQQKQQRLQGVVNVLVCFSTVILMSSVLLCKIPSTIATSAINLSNMNARKDHETKRIEFVQQLKQQNLKKMLVLSLKTQSFWMALLEQGTPQPMPSLVEMILVKDYEKVLTMIDNKQIDFVLIDQLDISPLAYIVDNNYELKPISASQDQSLLYAQIVQRKKQ